MHGIMNFKMKLSVLFFLIGFSLLNSCKDKEEMCCIVQIDVSNNSGSDGTITIVNRNTNEVLAQNESLLNLSNFFTTIKRDFTKPTPVIRYTFKVNGIIEVEVDQAIDNCGGFGIGL